MKSRLILFALLFALLTSGSATFPRFVSADDASSTPSVIPIGPTREDLEAKINERSRILDQINKQIQTTNQNLQTTTAQKNSLQQQLKTLDSNISQLELNIQSDEVTSQKLGLEIDSLNYDVRDIELTMSDKNMAITHVLQELQKTSNDTPLVIFLRNNSLADSVWETQSLKNLRTQLAIDVSSLTALQKEMRDKLGLVNMKKSDIETHQKNLAVKKTIVIDQKESRKVVLNQTKNKESEYQKQLADLKAQQDTISDDIAKIEDQLRASFDDSLLPNKRPGVFAWPVKMVSDGGVGRITQHFGEKSSLYRGKPHNGLDIGVPVGTPVYAAEDGVITGVDNNDKSKWAKYQYGKYILIKHANNLSTLYGHLSSQIVTKGQTVQRGELIGYSGSTGYATGPHLHFGVYWSASIQMKAIPPAAGLVPVGVVIMPEDYL